MKNKKIIVCGLIAVILALAFTALSLTGCDNSDTHTHEWEWVVTTPATPTADGLETETCKTCGAVNGTRIIGKINFAGTWKKDTFQFTMTGTEYTIIVNNANYRKGTLTYTDTQIVITDTHSWENNTWVVAGTYTPTTFSYTISGNNMNISGLVGSEAGFNGAWTRQ
jgi:hypothetical protein